HHPDLHPFPTRRSSDLLVAPVRDEVPAGRFEKCRIGAPDRVNRDDPPALVDGEPEPEHGFLFVEQLRWRIGRLQLGRRRQELWRSEEHTSELQSLAYLV